RGHELGEGKGKPGRCPFLIGRGKGRQNARLCFAPRPVAFLRRRRLVFGFPVFGFGLFCARCIRSSLGAPPVSQPWMWTLAYGYHEDRTPTHGYEPTREAAMAAFAKSWRRGESASRPLAALF